MMLTMVPNPAPVNRTFGHSPTDLETSRDLQYLPVTQGWIWGKNRTYWNLNGGLGDPGSSAALLSQSGVDPQLLTELVRAEKTKATMSIISASAVSLVALLSLGAFIMDRRKKR